jgi:solute carrier family 8 (sodium/calcium exchanger)
MCAIEKITSKTTIIKYPDPNDPNNLIDREFKVWNETVANLTLMALGSSSPEILLSIIEICGNNFLAGDLGPGTIVGKQTFLFT